MKSKDLNLLQEAYQLICRKEEFFVEGAAEDMVTNSLGKLNAPDNIVQLFLKKENNKLIFKPEHVSLLYTWIKDQNADTRTLEKDYKDYSKYFVNQPLTKFSSYLDWTEKVHAKRDEAEYHNRHKNVADIDVEGEDKQNVLANDENVLILKGDDEHKCVKYGKGYSFCISRGGGGNMYGNYRLSKSSTFYFVYFKKIPKEDERHIMVLDRTAEGWEWTFGTNHTQVVRGGWDEIVKEFPVLSKHKALFVNKPLTKEEGEYQRKLQIFSQKPSLAEFNKFSYKEKTDVLKFGMLIPLDLFTSLDKFLRNEWVSVGPTPMSDDIYKLLTDKEKERFMAVRKQQLQQRDIEDKYDVEVCKTDEALFEKHLKADKELSEQEGAKLQKFIYNGQFMADLRIRSKYFFPNLDNLKKAQNIYISYALEVNLPQLETCGDIVMSQAVPLSLPSLREAGKMVLHGATSLDLPNLQKCEQIDASQAMSVNLPQLQTFGDYLRVGGASTLNLPELVSGGNIVATSASVFSAPKLQKSLSIFAGVASSVQLPSLKESKKIYVTEVKKLVIPSSVMSNIVELPKDCEVIHPSEGEKLNDSYALTSFKQFFTEKYHKGYKKKGKRMVPSCKK
jgi:hypothetical protein